MTDENIKIMERIKLKRKELGYSFQDLADLTGMNKSTLQRYETGGIKNLPVDKLNILAKALQTTPYYIMGWNEEEMLSIPGIEPVPENELVPLLGDIACGTPILAQENIEAYVRVDKSVNPDFVLRCKGDSMINANIFNGDMVYIKSQPEVENGEIAAVLIDDETTLKRVYYYEDNVELRPENPTFKSLIYSKNDFKNINIIGKAVAFMRVL